MRTTVTFPVETYSDLVGRCHLTSREYAILRNGILSRANGPAGMVKILCEAQEAKLLYALAAHFYPHAVPYISKNVDRYGPGGQQPSFKQPNVVNSGFDFQTSEDELFWGEIFPAEHFVQIYDNDAVFMGNLERFAKGGLQANEGVIVIALPEHLRILEARLEGAGLNLKKFAAQDRYIALEAQQVLDQFMVKGWPDEDRFKQVVGDLIKRARRDGGKVRAFGEMVAILWAREMLGALWARGKQGATVRLEQLWQNLCEAELFYLFCAYPRAGFTRGPTESISEICAVHSRVIPLL
jgi:hypothetical protein